MSLVNTNSKYCQHWHTDPDQVAVAPSCPGSCFVSAGLIIYRYDDTRTN